MALVFSVATLYARNIPLHPIKMPACLNLGHGQEGRTCLRNKEITDESSGITAKQLGMNCLALILSPVKGEPFSEPSRQGGMF